MRLLLTVQDISLRKLPMEHHYAGRIEVEDVLEVCIPEEGLAQCFFVVASLI
jgi:hypothetical protein